MRKDELRRFISSSEEYHQYETSELMDSIPNGDNVVVALAYCGPDAGISFLSKSFKKVFG